MSLALFSFFASPCNLYSSCLVILVIYETKRNKKMLNCDANDEVFFACRHLYEKSTFIYIYLFLYSTSNQRLRTTFYSSEHLLASHFFECVIQLISHFKTKMQHFFTLSLPFYTQLFFRFVMMGFSACVTRKLFFVCFFA